jgi:peptidase E
MTKYILNSGSVSRYPEKYKAYIQEIIKGLGNNPKILLCFFAQKREDWEQAFIAKVENLKELMPDGVKAEFSLAMPENFVQQVKNNDAIIIHGGDDHLVKYWLEQYDLKELYKDKVVAGSSAGTNVLVKYFWTCDWRQNMQGLGLVPIKFLPHYKSDYGANDPRGPVAWDKAYKELKNYKEELEVYALEEGDYVVIT